MRNTPIQPGQLKIASWNSGGIRVNKLLLEELIEREKLDIIALQETKLRANDNLKFLGYDMYRNDHRANSGGTAILVRKEIDHYSTPTPDGLRTMEATTVTIRTNHGNLNVVSAYLRPQDILHIEDLDALIPPNTEVILIGDLNAKSPNWNSTTTNPKGRALVDYLDDNPQCSAIGPEEPTHFPPRGVPDVIDIALLRDCTFPVEMYSLQEGFGSHNPILLQLGDEEGEDVPKTVSRTNWIQFKRLVGGNLGNIPRIETHEDVDLALEHYENVIRQAISTSTRETATVKHSKFKAISQELKDLIVEKRRARRRANRTRNEMDKRHANNLALHVRDELKQYQDDMWKQHLDELDPQKPGLWTLQKVLRNPHKRIPTLHGPNGLVCTLEDKAEVFATSFENESQLNDHDDEDIDFTEAVENDWDNVPENIQSLAPTSPDEVKNIIKYVSAKKAPGRDRISNRAIKHLPQKAIVFLTTIINGILRTQYFPRLWKTAEVLMIPKPNKDPTFPQNYRPISLLPALSKIAERVILTRLKDQTSELNIIPDEQFGFRPQHSCELQVLRLVEHITKRFNWRQSTGAIFLDVSKAFDRVWHQGLVFKMKDQGYTTGMTELLKSYLSERKFQIKAGHILSRIGITEAGVPQGAVLSPLLYTIYTADIPKTPNTTMSLYADDTAIAASSTSARTVSRLLQEAATEIQEWCVKWKIKINAEKSQAVLFKKRRHTPDQEIELNGHDIPWSRTAKYLGVEMDQGLTFTKHVTMVVNKTKYARAKLNCLIGRKSNLLLKTKLRIINAVILPILLYASTAWGYTCRTNRKKIQAQHNISLRTAVNAYRYTPNRIIHRDLESTRVLELMRRKAESVFLALETHPNAELRDLTNYELQDWPRHARPRKILIQDTN